jgi:hypothetical protein
MASTLGGAVVKDADDKSGTSSGGSAQETWATKGKVIAEALATRRCVSVWAPSGGGAAGVEKRPVWQTEIRQIGGFMFGNLTLKGVTGLLDDPDWPYHALQTLNGITYCEAVKWLIPPGVDTRVFIESFLGMRPLEARHAEMRLASTLGWTNVSCGDPVAFIRRQVATAGWLEPWAIEPMAGESAR